MQQLASTKLRSILSSGAGDTLDKPHVMASRELDGLRSQQQRQGFYVGSNVGLHWNWRCLKWACPNNDRVSFAQSQVLQTHPNQTADDALPWLCVWDSIRKSTGLTSPSSCLSLERALAESGVSPPQKLKVKQFVWGYRPSKSNSNSASRFFDRWVGWAHCLARNSDRNRKQHQATYVCSSRHEKNNNSRPCLKCTSELAEPIAKEASS